MRYGALPVVAHVGGLCDTVIDANEMALANGIGTGFHFAPVQAEMLAAAIQREGMTLIPLKLYFNAKGTAKIEIGVAKGKKLHDKRETEKQRDWQRDKARLMRDKG